MKKIQILLSIPFLLFILLIFFIYIYNVQGKENENAQISPGKLINDEIAPDSDLILTGIKLSKKDLPNKIIASSDNFIKSFVKNEDIDKNFKFGKIIIYNNSEKNSKEYHIIYNYQIISYRENGKRTKSIYPIKIKLDENGNILDQHEPLEKYNRLKVEQVQND